MDVRKFALWWSTALFAAVVIAASSSATAQESTQVSQIRHETNASREARIQRSIKETYSHRLEIFGGGGFMRFRSGETNQKNNEITWNLAANYFLSQKVAIVADARGMFGNGKPSQAPQYIQYNTQSLHPQINEYAFTGGVNYRFYAREKFAVSAEGLGGMGWGMFSGGSKGLTYQETGFWKDAIRPAFIGGLNFDYNFYPELALRFAPSYVGTTFTNPTDGGSLQNNWGFNIGVVYRFGHQ
jgi:hypothetical protein